MALTRTVPGWYARYCAGVIRRGRSPLYSCVHNHLRSEEASECARDAWRVIKTLQSGDRLPAGWERHGSVDDTVV